MVVSCFIPAGVDPVVEICINGTTIISQTVLEDGASPLATFASEVDVFYLMFAGCLVFFMQAGFSMLEAGCVSWKNTQNILYKNLMDACLGAFCFWALGYGFAYGGGEDANPFIGTSNFFLMDESNEAASYQSFFFQWAFAATAATIVSGSVAERCSLPAYFIYSSILTIFVYPVVVHWVWSSAGWLSAFKSGEMIFELNMLDFAGSGVVHMVGGFSGLMGAIALGPRKGRFDAGGDDKYRPHSCLAAALGVAILWFGWYGFNAGSTLGINGYSAIAAKVLVTTTLAAAFGALTCTIYSRIRQKNWDLMLSLNGVLAGLVSITANCCVVDPWHSAVIGVLGAMVYIGSSALLKKLKIDDPLDAFPIHGCCGFFGVIAVGIFGTDENVKFGYNLGDLPTSLSSGTQFGVQLAGALAIAAWTLGTSGLMFFVMKKLGVLRVSDKFEEEGMDKSEHGGEAYTFGNAGDAIGMLVRPTGKAGTVPLDAKAAILN